MMKHFYFWWPFSSVCILCVWSCICACRGKEKEKIVGVWFWVGKEVCFDDVLLLFLAYVCVCACVYGYREKKKKREIIRYLDIILVGKEGVIAVFPVIRTHLFTNSESDTHDSFSIPFWMCHCFRPFLCYSLKFLPFPPK